MPVRQPSDLLAVGRQSGNFTKHVCIGCYYPAVVSASPSILGDHPVELVKDLLSLLF